MMEQDSKKIIIKCIAVDDEPMALELIKDYCNKIPFLDLNHVFTNPFDALTHLKSDNIDLVFLDIKMPEISGIQMKEKIKDFPAVIFTTAHSNYAVKSYNLDAIDYLLKPFDFDRFYKAIQKAKKQLNIELNDSNGDSILVKSEYSTIKIFLADIDYIEAMDNYIKIHMQDKYHLTQQSLKSILSQLPEKQFLRIHKSYIISLTKINHFSHKEVNLENVTLPIGRTYLKGFLEKINS